MDARALGFAADSFDTVCVADSLHHLANPESVLAEMERVLRPGGHLLLQEMYADKDQAAAQVSEVLVHSLAAEIDTLLGQYHRRPYTREEIRALVEGAGFVRLEVFASAWATKCAFCKYVSYCADPLRRAKVNQGLRTIRGALRKIKDHPAHGEYRARAKVLRQRVREHGYREAAVLFLVASK
jgi:SAM-dependent methyltransferase